MGFLERAIIEAILAGAVAGLVGTFVVLRRRAFFTTALTHATFPGAVLAAVLGVSVVLGAAAFSVLLVALMTLIARVRDQGAQVAAGVVLTFGFALGALLQSANPSLPISVESYLVGSILTVGFEQLLLQQPMVGAEAAQVLDTFVYFRGVLGGQWGVATAAGLLKGVIGTILVLSANRLAKRMGGEGIF